ncbi:RNA polymerase sigma factor (sigma-70 family) [Salibacterium salarium]|nr:RNA polymerase sigma factor (sigma-70 family) [Salibacterium salarium]
MVLDAPIDKGDETITVKETIKDDDQMIDEVTNKTIQETLINSDVYSEWFKLKPKQRHILNLIYLYQFTNDEISEYLDESKQVISYNHKKGLERLRKAYIGE